MLEYSGFGVCSGKVIEALSYDFSVVSAFQLESKAKGFRLYFPDTGQGGLERVREVGHSALISRVDGK